MHLFAPAAAWCVCRHTPDTPLPADEPAGENPPDGAILDSTGKLLRKQSSDDPITPIQPNRRPANMPQAGDED